MVICSSVSLRLLLEGLTTPAGRNINSRVLRCVKHICPRFVNYVVGIVVITGTHLQKQHRSLTQSCTRVLERETRSLCRWHQKHTRGCTRIVLFLECSSWRADCSFHCAIRSLSAIDTEVSGKKEVWPPQKPYFNEILKFKLHRFLTSFQMKL